MKGAFLFAIGKIAAVCAITIAWLTTTIGFFVYGELFAGRLDFFEMVCVVGSRLQYAGIITALMAMAYFVLDYLETEKRLPQRNFLAGVVTDASDRIIGAVQGVSDGPAPATGEGPAD